jgi:hypothetical protein
MINNGLEVDVLIALNFQTVIHIYTSLLHKYFVEEHSINNCNEFEKLSGCCNECFPFQPFRTSNLPSVFLSNHYRLKTCL